MLRLAPAALILCVMVPVPLMAQEEGDQPAILTVSSWVCPPASLTEINEAYETYTQPIEAELIDEGSLINTGVFFHAWGDEWNVNYFRIAPTMAGLFEAVAEVARRQEARHPGLMEREGNPFSVCTAHKDNIYYMPTTTASLDPGS